MALYSTLQKFITKEGAPVEGASVNVKLSGGAVDAELFAARTGTAKGNPFLTTANGEALCYVKAGRYDMTVTKGTDQIVFKDIEVGPVSNVGTFAEGGTVTDPDQLVEDADGNKWRWTGNLNYTYAAGENPELTHEWVKYINDYTGAENPKFLKWVARTEAQNPIYLIGDSITEGANATDYTTKSYAAIIRTSIQQHFGNRNYGFFNFNTSSPSVKYVSNHQTTGSITNIFIDKVYGGILLQLDDIGSTYSVDVWCKDFSVVYAKNVTGATCDVEVDGVSVGTIDTTATGASNGVITGAGFSDMGQFSNFFSAGYYGKHTIKFTATTSGAVRLLGMSASDGNFKLPGVFNVGRSSLRATQMPDDILQAYSSSGCTILALGVNDDLAGASIVDYEAKMRVVLDKVTEVNGECIMLDFIFSKPKSNAYKTVMRGLSKEYGYKLFDFADLWFSNSATNKSSGLLDADGVHPTNIGHKFIARTVLDSIGVPMVIDSTELDTFTGVLTPLLNPNWSEGQIPGYGGAYGSLNADQAIITGFLTNTSGGTLSGPSDILTLPELLDIDARMVFTVPSASGNVNIEVDGTRKVVKLMGGSTVPNGDWISLGGISYSTSRKITG